MKIKDVKVGDRIRWNLNTYRVMSVDEGDETLLCQPDDATKMSMWIKADDSVTLLEKSIRSVDVVSNPQHYTQHPSGVECITITEAFNFNVGNAIKYLWRAGLKGDVVEDLKKAAWYVQREIERREKGGCDDNG